MFVSCAPLFTVRRAVLNRWQEKFGLHATYRNLIIAFHNAQKMDYVEVVCQQLGGEWSSYDMLMLLSNEIICSYRGLSSYHAHNSRFWNWLVC